MKSYDQIDIIFIVLISLYLVVLFAIVCILVYGKKDEKPIPKRYKVIQIIKPKKEKKSKYVGKKKTVQPAKSTEKKNIPAKANNKPQTKKPNNNNNNKKKPAAKKNNNSNNNTRYKGNAPTKKKPQARKKSPKTNGKNKKK